MEYLSKYLYTSKEFLISMYNVLVFDSKLGVGFDVDYLDDGRVIVDKVSTEDMGLSNGGNSWLVKKK